MVRTRKSAARSERFRRLACVLACCLGCGISQAARGQLATTEASVSREYPLKALFLYNFGSYVEWPAEAFPTAQSPFVIGILGSAPLEATLKELAATKTIAGRRIVVEHFSSLDQVGPCQILFIARNVNPQQQRTELERLGNRPVLVVGESDGFAALGASVNFVVEANKIGFEINLDAARLHQLKISSKLLALAKIVQGDPRTSKVSGQLNP